MKLKEGFEAELCPVFSSQLIIVFEVNLKVSKMILTFLDSQSFDICGRFHLNLRADRLVEKPYIKFARQILNDYLIIDMQAYVWPSSQYKTFILFQNTSSDERIPRFKVTQSLVHEEDYQICK